MGKPVRKGSSSQWHLAVATLGTALALTKSTNALFRQLLRFTLFLRDGDSSRDLHSGNCLYARTLPQCQSTCSQNTGFRRPDESALPSRGQGLQLILRLSSTLAHLGKLH